MGFLDIVIYGICLVISVFLMQFAVKAICVMAVFFIAQSEKKREGKE